MLFSYAARAAITGVAFPVFFLCSHAARNSRSNGFPSINDGFLQDNAAMVLSLRVLSLWLEADMRTSDRRDDVNEKSEPVAAEHSNSAARVRELLGPAIAARL